MESDAKSIVTKEPNFFVCGVVKGGTTSLYHYLSQHHDVYLSPIKETNHFAQEDIQPEHFTTAYKHDVSIDIDKFLNSERKEAVHIAHVNDELQYKRLFEGNESAHAVGEFSNSYAVCPSAAKSLHAKYPDSRLIFVLRNPITRIWSQYLMNIREGKVSKDCFLEEIKHDTAQKHQGWGVSHQYLELGNYYNQIKRFQDLFGTQNLLILFYEDYRTDALNVIKRVFHFLDIDENISLDLSKEYNAAQLPRSQTINKLLVETGIIKFAKSLFGRNTRQKLASLLYSSKKKLEMSEEERLWLVNYYENDVKNLSNLLNKDLITMWGFNHG